MKNSRVLSYIKELKPQVMLAAILFAISIVHGLLMARDPEFAKSVVNNVQETFAPIVALENWQMFLVIFLNNGLKAIIVSFAGILFGIAPFLFVWGNGVIIGIFLAYFNQQGELGNFLASIAPHGTLEIPALILATAVGFKLGGTLKQKIFLRKGSVKNELLRAIYFFAKILLPLIFTAAVIESFITPLVIDFFVGNVVI